MPMANHEAQRFLWAVFADGRDLVLFVIDRLQIHVIPATAHFVHDFIFFFNPSVIHRFLLVQLRNVTVNEPIVISVVHDFRLTNEFQRRFETVTGVRGFLL